jgi:hypothetical protein
MQMPKHNNNHCLSMLRLEDYVGLLTRDWPIPIDESVHLVTNMEEDAQAEGFFPEECHVDRETDSEPYEDFFGSL